MLLLLARTVGWEALSWLCRHLDRCDGRTPASAGGKRLELERLKAKPPPTTGRILADAADRYRELVVEFGEMFIPCPPAAAWFRQAEID